MNTSENNHMEYSRLISSMEESATLGIARRVRELKAEGKNIVGLTLGEPDFDTPTHIREAAKKALDDGYTHYPPVDGLPELKEAIVEKFKRDNGLTYSPKQVFVSTGAKQSLYNVVLALLNPGDEVVIPAPYWVSYDAMVYLAQATAKYIPTDTASNYKITTEQLEEALTPQSKLLFFNTPSNPTGSMYTQAELQALVAVMEKYPNLYILSDEIYEYITYGTHHISLGSFESIFDRVITVNGFSKGFAMTGWRLGYIASADSQLIKLCGNLQGQSTSGANAFAQKGAVAALTEDLTPTYEMRDAFLQRRDMVYEKLKHIEGVMAPLPEGAFYFYPDFSAFLGKTAPNGNVISSIDDFCLYLIEEEGLAMVTGSAFGTQTHARISYAYSTAILEDALDRLAKGIAKLS